MVAEKRRVHPPTAADDAYIALQASFRVPLERLHQRMIGCDAIGAARESRFHLRFEVAVGRGDFVEQ